MKLNLNFWQTLSLFMPFFFSIPFITIFHTTLFYALANSLIVLNILIVVFYQSFLLINFIRASGINANGYKVNALIPCLFILLYFLWISILWLIEKNNFMTNYHPGPIRKEDLDLRGYLIILFLGHSFVTFYFVNNQFVSSRIKKIVDPEKQLKLQLDYLFPMKRLTKTSIWVMVTCLGLSVILGLIKSK
jgi:hypothetical protein